ncbi:8204_t:CDS:10 [Cetraspora pellucida]|uniref:8204_t:CDS:1 n=1 Tax=Cetraspora pellucida TaxID=1433469 RepID=A0A9N9CJY8_9GLOM|nr:8204_t:CDS:10 [Cetraspora pellucida]
MVGGKKFKPKEPYTHRLKKILEDYPESSQVLREILQNSDDAKSTEQVFILDHNTYSTESLLMPGLSRFQGPALLSKNNTKFNDDDFTSLENLANSEKQGQYDKIGEMGVGFNSIYHLCDSCSFITDNNFAILDPHEWCYEGGHVYDFIEDNLSETYPDQFDPFKKLGKLSIPCDGTFEGTIFRYPLRTKQGSKESKISKSTYEPDQVLEMFKPFFEKDSINCLLFLRYIECIEFYELEKGKTEPELIYRISLKDAEIVRKDRQMVAKEIGPMMKNLKENKLNQQTTLCTTYRVSLVRHEKKVEVEDSSWFIVNMLGDLHDAKHCFPDDFGERLGTVPIVGLAAKLNSGHDEDKLHGELFCFFPLQMDTPFRVSINGLFAVTNNRRGLWSGINNDLVTKSLANLKVSWNNYLFEKIIPQAWIKFLINIRPHVPSKDYYKFWPILAPDDETFCESGKMLSVSTGYFQDELYVGSVTPSILNKIEFSIIHAPSEIIKTLKKSDKHSLKFYSPSIISIFLKNNRGKWQNKLTREEILELFDYLLNDENNEILEGLQMIPLANGTFKTISRLSRRGTITYICPDSFIGENENDPHELFKDQLDKFIAKDISNSLLSRLCDKVTTNGWNFNIKMLTVPIIADMINVKISLNHHNSNEDEIDMENRFEWINQLWKYLCNKFSENDFISFENIHLIPTKQNTLRKLKKDQIKYFWNSTEGLQNSFDQIHSILEKLGIIFVNREFEDNIANLRTSDITSVLSSLNTNEDYNLSSSEAELLIKYLSYYLYITPSLTDDYIKIIKCLPIFKEVGKDEIISLRSNEKVLLLPSEDEKDYGQIIAPKEFKFLDATSTDTCYLLEKIKIPRLSQAQYWIYYVIPYLKNLSNYENADIVVERLFERLPTLIRLNSSLKSTLSKLDIVPCGTIQMVQEKKVLDAIKCKPIDLYDPLNDKIAQLFFDDEKVFPVGKFSNQDNLHYYILKELGIKTLLSSKDIIKRIETYSERQKTANDINDVYDKSLKLFIYIDKNWDSLKDKNDEFLSIIKSSKWKWIPTIDQYGKKSFSCSSECRDKRDEDLVSLVLSILDYKITSTPFLKHLEWKRYPRVEIVLSQMMQCSTMSKDNLNIKNRPNICKAIYKYIDGALSHDDEQFKKEVKEGLKNLKWIFCEGDFYTTKNVVFDLSTNFGKELSIVQLPSDYCNDFSNMFKSMGVREKVNISDFINIIENIAHEANNRPLNDDNLSKTIRILEQIGKECNKSKKEGKHNDLKDLFIPSTNAILVSFEEIKFDNRTGLSSEEKENCKLSHPKISLALAKELGIRMLSEIFTTGSEIDFEDYEQSEPLTTRIRTIISNCSLDSLFKEFLQNADDAGAHRFSIYIDERPLHENDHSSLLSEEMYNWQGPAVWIYNDAIFEPKDFSSLIKLGVGSKSNDESKIGRFGVGITTSYHLTDVLSFVSGEQIAFLDPHAKFLPIRGNPQKRPRGIKLNFLEKKFLTRFEDQCRPYLAIKDCDFKKSFNGTLFRLPLRSIELSKKSLISQNFENPKDILDYLRGIKGSDEILFLRNIGIYSIYHIDKDKCGPQLIWEAKIQNLKDIKNIRSKVDYKPQIFQLETKIYRYDQQKEKTTSEMWLVCTGGNTEITDKELSNFSKNEGLTAHGGVAAILARSNKESLNNPLDLTDPPDLDGKEYAYVSCNGSTNLGVHINGNFSLNEDRTVILQQNDNIKGKWNKFILLEILPSLHVKLLGKIAEIYYEHFKNSNIENFGITKKFWPFSRVKQGSYYSYAIKVLQNLNDSKVFWTEANGGKFVSLNNAYFSEENDFDIANMLAKHGISTVKIDKNEFDQLKESQNQKGKPAQKYQSINSESVCDLLKDNKVLQSIQQNFTNILSLLKFVLKNKNVYSNLTGLQLVPLKNGSFGTFGERTYYIAKQEHQNLFPKSGPSRFIYNSDDDLNEIFKSKDFLRITNIKKLDASGILDLLDEELPNEQEIDWDPSSKNVPNRQWLDDIFEKMKWCMGLEITRLSRYPLLPVILPYNKLVRMDSSNPLLNYPDSPDEVFIHALGKLGICLTNIKFNNRNIDKSEFFNKGVAKWSYFNVFDSIRKKRSSQNISMESLFETAKLNDNELKRFREFVKEFFNLQNPQGQKDKNIVEIIKELPIWRIVSSSQNKYVTAKKGKLPPRSLSCPLQDTDIFIEGDEYFNVLVELGAKKIEAYAYVKQHYPPGSSRAPTPQDVEFLEEILLLRDPEIEKYLENCESIPNKNLKAFVRVNTLYDANVDLFNRIFDDDKFLPSKLQNNNKCCNALGDIGLKRVMDTTAYIDCAREIQKKINDVPYNYTDEDIRSIAKELTEILEGSNFIPSNKELPNPYSNTAFYTLGFESFNSLCSEKYINICWTKVPFFDSDIPQFERPPDIDTVIEHWNSLFIEIISQDDSIWEVNTIYKIMNEIYTFVMEKGITKSKLKNLRFLNGDNPFDPNCWVLGEHLAFDIQGDIGELFKVHPRLEQFKELLIDAGAQIVDNNIDIKPEPIKSRKAELINYLLEYLRVQNHNSQYHDVTFQIGNHKIGANRFVLSDVAKYFDWNFSENPIIINDIQPDTYKVLLRCLYGMTYRNAVEDVFGEEFDGQDYIKFIFDIWKASNKCPRLNSIIQNNFIKRGLVNESNVLEILNLSHKYKANLLENYCKEYIKRNKGILDAISTTQNTPQNCADTQNIP